MNTNEVAVPETAELKYCEFCGALWLRPGGSDAAYCPQCESWIEAELPRLAQGEA